MPCIKPSNIMLLPMLMKTGDPLRLRTDLTSTRYASAGPQDSVLTGSSLHHSNTAVWPMITSASAAGFELAVRPWIDQPGCLGGLRRYQHGGTPPCS
jgi:hypothetical protein